MNTSCPFCGAPIDSQLPVDHQHKVMNDGDVSLCCKCAEVSVIQGDSLRKPTASEAKKFSMDSRLQAAQSVIRRHRADRKSDTLVFSGADAAYRKLADITFPIMDTWARLRGWQFTGFLGMPKDSGLNAFWTGVAWGLAKLREGYKRIIYLDADQFITNVQTDFSEIPYHGFHASKDWGSDATEPWHFSMCGFIAHQDCIDFFETALKLQKLPEFAEGTPFQEQAAVQAIAKVGFESYPNAADRMVHVHPRKVFNCVPDAILPGEIPEPWAEGDFSAHLTMVPMERRLELIHQFIPATIRSLKQCLLTDTHWTKSGGQSVAQS